MVLCRQLVARRPDPAKSSCLYQLLFALLLYLPSRDIATTTSQHKSVHNVITYFLFQLANMQRLLAPSAEEVR